MKFIKPLHVSLVNHYIHDLVKNEIVKHANGYVLDIGCGEKPFYGYIQKQIEIYIGLDYPGTQHLKEHIDIFGIANDLPFKKASFDMILLTQVIEHLEDPQKVFFEVNRVLKQNGVLVISWPFLYPVHEAPRDFFRYTEFRMRYLATQAGFIVKSLVPVSGFWITFFSFLSIYIYSKSKIIYLMFLPLLFIFKWLCIFFSKLDVKSNTRWTWNFYAILKKG